MLTNFSTEIIQTGTGALSDLMLGV
jgi:hypothetical protein